MEIIAYTPVHINHAMVIPNYGPAAKYGMLIVVAKFKKI